MIKLNEYDKLTIKRGKIPNERVSEIVIARGKAKYMRLTPCFLETYHLEDKKRVDIFIREEDRKSIVIFSFRDDDKGILKLSKNEERGIGYISGASLFKKLEIDNDTLKETHFIPREDTDGKNKVYIIEIPKN
jgi:hypothetical protein